MLSKSLLSNFFVCTTSAYRTIAQYSLTSKNSSRWNNIEQDLVESLKVRLKGQDWPLSSYLAIREASQVAVVVKNPPGMQET